MGGAAAGTRRLSRAIRLGSAALAAVSRAGTGQGANAGTFDVAALSGLSSDIAIARIVDAFCPPGIGDEDALRAAIGETLAELLASADTFDPTALDPNAVRLAMLRFVAELVFVTVSADAGNSLDSVSPLVAVEREASLRDLIREVADHVGTPILQAAGNLLTTAAVTNLVSNVVTAVQVEIATWE